MHAEIVRGRRESKRKAGFIAQKARDGGEFLTPLKGEWVRNVIVGVLPQANGVPNDRVWRFTVVKLLLKKIRELLERARKWNAHEDGAAGRVEYASVPYWRPWRDF